MKNKEKFEKEILEIACKGTTFGVNKNTIKPEICAIFGNAIKCSDCLMHDRSKTCEEKRAEWCEQEYTEDPEMDWSKIAVDTPIYVREYGSPWIPRHFAKFENGYVIAFLDGKTSFTTGKTRMWEQAKLAEPEEE